MKTILSIISALAMTCQSLLAYSTPGHRAIAEAALRMLKDTQAETNVRQILGNEKEADAAIWLDLVRENALETPEAKQEGKDFGKHFPHNAGWHFTNYPVGSTKYDTQGTFSKSDDVVHALENAVSVLEGSPSPMTKRQALRIVIHLVGDIHQPLHCITGYYDLTDMAHPKLVTNARDISHLAEDRGGNQLYYSKSQELHALWDRGLPDFAARAENTSLVEMAVGHGLSGDLKTRGDYHHWPEAWASDTMQQANAAYDGIAFGQAAYVPSARHAGKKDLHISIELPGGLTGYERNQKDRTSTQLHKAAAHLAQLLAAIKYK